MHWLLGCLCRAKLKKLSGLLCRAHVHGIVAQHIGAQNSRAHMLRLMMLLDVEHANTRPAVAPEIYKQIQVVVCGPVGCMSVIQDVSSARCKPSRLNQVPNLQSCVVRLALRLFDCFPQSQILSVCCPSTRSANSSHCALWALEFLSPAGPNSIRLLPSTYGGSCSC